ncbi:MAG: hypothetical protein GX567_15290 [Clostridia bacterium]|nr:hypothetical protein [Clostridia bacterium]
MSTKIKNSNLTKLIFLLLIGVVSVLITWGASGFKSEFMLVDDNRNQWEPIINTAYERYIETGKMPVYNFYQAKGLEIADEGYYGVYNPIMFLSFLLQRFVLCNDCFSTITFYIFFMIMAGSICAYLLCRKLSMRVDQSLFIVFMYLGCSTFIRYGHWYYVYNNFWLIPFLLYIFLKTRHKKVLSYISCGTILGFSILLGNVQYTVYQYMVYCILMLVVAIAVNWKYVVKMITNCLIGVTMSIPYLLMMFESTKRSLSFSDKSEFMLNDLTIQGSIIMSVVPNAILHAINSELAENLNMFLLTDTMGEREASVAYLGGFSICMLTLIVMSVGYLFRFYQKNKNKFNKQMNFQTLITKLSGVLKKILQIDTEEHFMNAFILGIFLTVLFFFSFMTSGWVALILQYVPVINGFRYLFKCIFIIVPLLIVLVAFLLKKISGKKQEKTVIIISVIFTLLGFANNYFVVNDFQISHYGFMISETLPEEVTQIKEALRANQVDTDNYRVCGFLEPRGTTKESAEKIMKTSFDVKSKIIRNIGTMAQVCTLNAYEMTMSKLSIKQSDCIQNDKWYTRYANADTPDIMLAYLYSKDKKVLNQINQNAVKYYFFTAESKELEEFKRIIEEHPDFSIKREFPFLDRTTVVELEEVDSLCMQGSEQVVPEIDYDEIRIPVTESKEPYRLSFTYKDLLKAEWSDAQDEKLKKEVEISQDEDGYVLITNTTGKAGIIKLYYDNPLCEIGKYVSVILTVLFVGLMILSCYNKADRGSADDRRI